MLPAATGAPPLAGSAWRVTGYDNGRHEVVAVLADTELTLSFAEDRVAGSAGCNRYQAGYTVGGPGVVIGPAMVTRRMCSRPDRVMEQERAFVKALETVAAARIDADRLELRTATGALAVAATRATQLQRGPK